LNIVHFSSVRLLTSCYDVPSRIFETENELFIAGYCPVDKQSDDMVTVNPVDGLLK
jgi:hypothetical protein